LYGCETWSLTLREEHRLRVFENTVLRRIFGPKRDEVTGEWRKLHNEELRNLYPSPDIIRQVKSRRMRWAGHVARMGEERKVYKVLVERPKGKRPLGRPRRRWEDGIGIRMDLREIGLGGCGLDLSSAGQGPVVGCCECGDETSSSYTTELVSVFVGVLVFYCVRLAFTAKWHKSRFLTFTRLFTFTIMYTYLTFII
jgi:hypothetical protein